MRTWLRTTIASVVCACSACDRSSASPDGRSTAEPLAQTAAVQPPLREDPGTLNGQPITRLIAVLHPTAGNAVRGTVTLTTHESGGVIVRADVLGLAPGKHAYHVHQFGDCSGEHAKTAGAHFNFEGSSENPGPGVQRITGNLGELEAGADGHASATTMIGEAAIQGSYSVIGRSVIIHARGNDLAHPPDGAAGDRLACGVLGVDDAAGAATKKAAVTSTSLGGAG